MERTLSTEAFRETYDSYHRAIFAFCLHQTRNTEEAEDITQDVFVKFARSGAEIGPEARKQWLYKVASRACIDRWRGLSRVRRLLGTITTKSIENPVDKVAINDEVHALLDILDKNSRIVLLLRYMEDFEYSDISKMLKIPVGTLKSMVHRALGKMRSHSNHKEALAWTKA